MSIAASTQFLLPQQVPLAQPARSACDVIRSPQEAKFPLPSCFLLRGLGAILQPQTPLTSAFSLNEPFNATALRTPTLKCNKAPWLNIGSWCNALQLPYIANKSYVWPASKTEVSHQTKMLLITCLRNNVKNIKILCTTLRLKACKRWALQVCY